MISLFLDTCNHNIIVAIIKNDETIYKKNIENKNDLSEKLLPIIKEGIESTNHKINDIEKIYISNGPGSFTGIRIGVTVAKTLAWALKKDIITISSLEVIASINTDKKYICPLIDARRGAVYTGIYDNDLNEIISNTYTNMNEFIENLNINKEDILFVSYENLLDNIELPNVDIIKIINKHKNDISINSHQVNPIYLKLTEAEEKLNDISNK